MEEKTLRVAARYQFALEQINSLDSLRKPQAVKYLYKLIGKIPDGIFSDNSWVPIHKIFSAFRQNDVNYDLYSTDYIHDEEGKAKAKIWKFKIYFVNDKGRPTTIYGTITAAGAGSIENPLDRYDVTVTLG
jgi:hypothetical protein